jgi:hypothetical protein
MRVIGVPVKNVHEPLPVTKLEHYRYGSLLGDTCSGCRRTVCTGRAAVGPGTKRPCGGRGKGGTTVSMLLLRKGNIAPEEGAGVGGRR